MGRQRLVLLLVEQEVDRRAAFPPTGIVVIGRDLGEAELLVVIGADPFGAVDGALFQRRVDVAAGDLLRHDAQLLGHGAGKAAQTDLEALQVFDGVDLLAIPAAHLGTGIAARQAEQVLRRQEFVEQVDPAAVILPGVHRPGRQAEGHGRAKRPGRILAPVIIGHGMRRIHGALAGGIGGLQAGHDLAGGEDLDLELAIGGVADHLRHHFGATIDGVERFRE